MKLLAIFAGKPVTVSHQGREITTGIYKHEVKGQVKVNTLNLEGDAQADLKVHGGPDKAVYAYPSEHYEFWKTQRPDLHFEMGKFGENLSIEGLGEDQVFVGDKFRIGSAAFTVTTPRMPCSKLGIKMEDPTFLKDFLKANRNGFYLKVITEGWIEAGNSIEKIGDDGHGLSIQDVARLYHEDKENYNLLEKATSSPSLPEDWRWFFAKNLEKLSK